MPKSLIHVEHRHSCLCRVCLYLRFFIRVDPRKSAVRLFLSGIRPVCTLCTRVPPSPFFADTTRTKGLAQTGPRATLGPPKPHPMPGGFLWNQKPRARARLKAAFYSVIKEQAQPRPQTSLCVIPQKCYAYQCHNLSIPAFHA